MAVPGDAVKSGVQRQYTRQAPLYASSRTHAEGDTLEWLAEHAGRCGGSWALDVATGAGFAAFTLASCLDKVVALDLTRAMLEEARRTAEARRLPNVLFVEGDAEALPFGPQHFDLIASRMAAHHFASATRFLDEAARVLRPGGRIALIDTCSREETDMQTWQERAEVLRDPSHVRNMTPSEWETLLVAAGFAVEELSRAHRVDLVFSDWVRRAGTAPDAVAALRQHFATATPPVARAFSIARQGKDYTFAWPVIAVVGRR